MDKTNGLIIAGSLSVLALCVLTAVALEQPTAAPTRTVPSQSTQTLTEPGAAPGTALAPVPPPAITDAEIEQLALDITWQNASADERAILCEGVNTYGLAFSAQLLSDGAGGSISVATASEHLSEVC